MKKLSTYLIEYLYEIGLARNSVMMDLERQDARAIPNMMARHGLYKSEFYLVPDGFVEAAPFLGGQPFACFEPGTGTGDSRWTLEQHESRRSRIN